MEVLHARLIVLGKHAWPSLSLLVVTNFIDALLQDGRLHLRARNDCFVVRGREHAQIGCAPLFAISESMCLTIPAGEHLGRDVVWSHI